MKSRDRKRWRLVEKTTRRYAAAFGLRLRKVKPLGRKTAGKCYHDGTVFISLRDRDGLRTHYFVLDSIAHELAHLAFFNHREEWVRLFAKILRRMVKKKEFDRFRGRW